MVVLFGRRSVRSRLTGCVLTVVLIASMSGCVRAVDGAPATPKAADAQLAVRGDSHDTFDTQVKNALADISAYWRQAYPSISSGRELRPLTGALYSIDGAAVLRTRTLAPSARSNACLKRDMLFIVDNAAYCVLDDSILWDRAAGHLLPALGDQYGTAVIALVAAHEFGHAIQQRLGTDESASTIESESQADCAAGAFIATAMAGQAPHFRLTPKQVDRALDGFLLIRDSTPDAPQDISHGNGFDRLNALQDGIQRGAKYCFASSYFDDRGFTERGYTDDDYYTGGNEALAEVLGEGLVGDLNRFWTAAGAEIESTFAPVRLVQADHPRCGSTDPASAFGYCPADNTVYYSAGFAHDAYYSLTVLTANPTTGEVTFRHDQPADYALGSLLAVAWGMAARHQFFDGSISNRAALMAAICYSGAYAEDINRTDHDPNHPFVLSPPDMDEASSAMLALVDRSDAFGGRATSGLERIQAFVTGYEGGLSAC